MPNNKRKRNFDVAKSEIEKRVAERRERQQTANNNHWNTNNNDDNNQDKREYLKEIFRKRIKNESDKKRKKQLENMYQYFDTTANTVSLSELHLCVNPSHNLKYYGHSIFLTCRLLGGDEERFKQKLGIKNKQTKSLKKTKKRKKKPEKKYQERKLQNNKLKEPATTKSKPKLFTDVFSKQYAKFNKHYKSLSYTNSQNTVTKPSEFAFKSHINKCSDFNSNDIKIILSGYSHPFKIICTAYYVCKYINPNTQGEVTRIDMKDYGPMIYDGTWNMDKPIINEIGSWLLLSYKNANDKSTFILCEHAIKLFDDWAKWKNNIVHPFLMKEVNEIINENKNKSEQENDTDNEDDNTYNMENEKDELDNENDNDEFDEIEKENMEIDEIVMENAENDGNIASVDNASTQGLLECLKQYSLDEKHILNALTNRKRPVTLDELLMIPSADLNEYLKNKLHLDAIDIIRFRKMLNECNK